MSCKEHSDVKVYGEYGQRGCVNCVTPNTTPLNEELAKEWLSEHILGYNGENYKNLTTSLTKLIQTLELKARISELVDVPLSSNIQEVRDSIQSRIEELSAQITQLQGAENERLTLHN